MKKYQNFTNAELNIKMKSLENEYETTKHKILELVEKLEKLDSEYTEAQTEVENRNKGIWQ